MGAVVSASQTLDVLEKAALIGAEAERVYGNPYDFNVEGADKDKGAFVPPMLFHCAAPDLAERVHDTEAFGPVSTIMPYRDVSHAITLLNKGKGSLGGDPCCPAPIAQRWMGDIREIRPHQPSQADSRRARAVCLGKSAHLCRPNCDGRPVAACAHGDGV